MKVLCTIGTRPEAIKMAPVIQAMKRSPDFQCRVLATAQHRQMLDQVLGLFGIVPDIDLDIMQPNQGLSALTGRLLIRLEDVLKSEAPDAVLAQGDTTTVMATALASCYAGIDFGHVEAGLRTGNMRNPFPEELNRVLTAHMTRWHFAPTERAEARLRAEGYDSASIYMTGNTVIDALQQVAAGQPRLPVPLDPACRMLLVTLHRRENFGAPLARICDALGQILARNRDVEILLPVHHNPNVRRVIQARFAGVDRVTLCEPLDYAAFVAAMKRAFMILTDSGGVQEEAPALGKPVLVLRETTERPEAVEAGVAALVGTGTEAIRRKAQTLLDDPAAYQAMVRPCSPYGDGRAAERILGILRAGRSARLAS